MYYSHKAFTGTVTKAEKDGVLITQVGDFPVKKGDLVFNPINGDPQVLTEQRFGELYVAVEPVNRKPKKQLSPFEEHYMNQIIEFGSLDSQEEDAEYIEGTRKLVNKI